MGFSNLKYLLISYFFMPQMAPMNWTLLFSIFICAYLMSMMMN